MQYDLEKQTQNFAGRVNAYVNKLPRSIVNTENGKQLVRAAGSVGANYIEANESLSKKDFSMRVKIFRKEAKESRYWLSLAEPSQEYVPERDILFKEATELVKIFGSIVEKSKSF